MNTFTYTGVDADGKGVTGTVEAPDRFAVYDIARGYYEVFSKQGIRVAEDDAKATLTESITTNY